MKTLAVKTWMEFNQHDRHGEPWGIIEIVNEIEAIKNKDGSNLQFRNQLCSAAISDGVKEVFTGEMSLEDFEKKLDEKFGKKFQNANHWPLTKGLK